MSQLYTSKYEFQKLNDMQGQQIDMMIQRGVELKREAQERMRTRTPKAVPPGNEYNQDEVAPEAAIYRSVTLNGKHLPAPRVRKFKDERGMTISIIEEENQIRIHLSDN